MGILKKKKRSKSARKRATGKKKRPSSRKPPTKPRKRRKSAPRKKQGKGVFAFVNLSQEGIRLVSTMTQLRKMFKALEPKTESLYSLEVRDLAVAYGYTPGQPDIYIYGPGHGGIALYLHPLSRREIRISKKLEGLPGCTIMCCPVPLQPREIALLVERKMRMIEKRILKEQAAAEQIN